MNARAKIIQATLVSLLMVACGPPHIRPFTPRERAYKSGKYAQTQKGSEPSEGSLWSEAQPGFLEDTRALRVGDIVHIKILEEADAQGNASTNLTKSSSREGGVQKLLGIMPALQRKYPNLDPTALIAMAAQQDFSGEGKTSRAGKLKGSVGVQVKRELPNGDLYVEGTKVVMINHEEYHLYVSGVLRPADIEEDNSVDSSLIADARVEFTGRGDVAQTTRRGWFGRLVEAINPF